MLKRRQFIGALTALGGSVVLSACGGGGTEEAGATTSSSGAQKTSAMAKTTSPNGAAMPPATSLIDGTGATWTLSGGVAYRNGAKAGNNYNVNLVLWYGGKIYCRNMSGQFYANAEVAAQWLPCSDPRTPVAATAGSFFGINGHFDYTYTPAQIVSILKGLGCTSYRVGCTADANELNAVVKLAQAFQSAGMTLLVLVNLGFRDSNGNLLAGESAAYNACYGSAFTIANTLKPYGVTFYECGNELTRDDAIIIDSTNAGTKALDFNNANWPTMRGMIDGVKAAQPSAKCGINFCVADVGASDALWDGMQPDGSGGHPKVRWDITTWHNYEVYGDIFNIGTDGAGLGIDLPTYCKARYGVPFFITEWNTGPEQTQSYRATYITSQLNSFYAARKTHNIQSVMYYVLDSGNNTFGIVTNGTALNPPYGAFTTFTSSHADT
ncbi:MAG: FIG00458818: hypothetical protein [uncultured Paraburkholderia sp.]|nr:MAG: FIG00458818: hypothetical protein [uncultured Paraburkholderia sp.]CAH2942461.1 MAG: FIG00458818: hypothetical protein [uncultured Paraburkholderia sp.]